MKVIYRIILIAAVASTVACATFEVEGVGSITPDAIRGSETVHGSLYGFQWRASDIEKCGDQTLFRVEVNTNVALLLASVVSLGLYVPQTVEWWCNSADTDAADEEEWDPTAALRQE